MGLPFYLYCSTAHKITLGRDRFEQKTNLFCVPTIILKNVTNMTVTQEKRGIF